MKKLLVISNTSFSIEKFRSHYLNRISQKYNILVSTPQKKPRNINDIKFKKINDQTIINSIINLYKIIKNYKPNMIIVYSLKYQFLISILSLLFNSRFIFLIAGKGSLYLTQKKYLIMIREIIIRLILNRGNDIIFINPYDKLFFEKNYNIIGKSHLIPTEGIKIGKQINKKNKKINFLFFARIIKEKGIDDYLSAANILKKKYPQINFYIAGPTQKREIGESLLFQKKINYKKIILQNKNVKYLGFLEDYKLIFKNFDCLISPSFTEGAGTSVMEALSYGLFVIGYSNNGHKYLLKNTGNIICKNNTPKDLILAIEDYLKFSNNKIITTRKKSYKSVKRFDSKNISSSILKILNKK